MFSLQGESGESWMFGSKIYDGAVDWKIVKSRCFLLFYYLYWETTILSSCSSIFPDCSVLVVGTGKKEKTLDIFLVDEESERQWKAEEYGMMTILPKINGMLHVFLLQLLIIMRVVNWQIKSIKTTYFRHCLLHSCLRKLFILRIGLTSQLYCSLQFALSNKAVVTPF